jgi:hypothetical protein
VQSFSWQEFELFWGSGTEAVFKDVHKDTLCESLQLMHMLLKINSNNGHHTLESDAGSLHQT